MRSFPTMVVSWRVARPEFHKLLTQVSLRQGLQVFRVRIMGLGTAERVLTLAFMQVMSLHTRLVAIIRVSAGISQRTTEHTLIPTAKSLVSTGQEMIFITWVWTSGPMVLKQLLCLDRSG